MSADPPPRLVPEVPLPPYTFVPGRFPHPFSDPRGHSFGTPAEQPPPLDPTRWQDSRAYRYGVDLFNRGFYWESHEAWEGLWHACGRRGTTADFLKGLIKLAAAGVKHLEGKPAGVKSHARRAAELWQGIARSLKDGQDLFLGLRVGDLMARAEQVYREGWPEKAIILLPTFPGSEVGRSG